MVTKTIKREFRRLRDKGWQASHAWREAKARARFDELEAAGVVRLRIELDETLYDDSYIDTDPDVPEAQRERERKAIWARIEREGVWGIVAEYLDPVDGWTGVDSCWGFVGDDWQDSGYDGDVRDSAVTAFEAIDVRLCAGWV